MGYPAGTGWSGNAGRGGGVNSDLEGAGGGGFGGGGCVTPTSETILGGEGGGSFAAPSRITDVSLGERRGLVPASGWIEVLFEVRPD